MGSGDIQEIHKDPTIPAELRRAMLPKVKADAPFGKWNRFFITLKGDRVTVVLNDQTVIDNAQLPGIPAEGPIALHVPRDDRPVLQLAAMAACSSQMMLGMSSGA